MSWSDDVICCGQALAELGLIGFIGDKTSDLIRSVRRSISVVLLFSISNSLSLSFSLFLSFPLILFLSFSLPLFLSVCLYLSIYLSPSGFALTCVMSCHQVDEDSRLTVAMIAILWISALASSFIDNIPFTTAMVRTCNPLSPASPFSLPHTHIA